MVIGATVGASLRSAIGSTITQFGRLGQAVADSEQQQAAALKDSARLDKLNLQVQGYRRLGREVLEAGRAHRDAQEKVKGLAREIAATETPTKKQEAALAAARREVVRTAAAEDAKRQRLVALRGELNAAGVDTRNLAQAERKLAADIAQAKSRVDQAAASVDRLGDAMARAEKRKEIGAELRNQALKVGAAYLALKQPLDQEGDFEHQLRSFGNTAGMTGEELEGVRRKIRGMSMDVNQSNSALLSGIEVLVGKGLGAKEALMASTAIGRAATATGASMEDMSNLSYNVLSNLHVPVEKLGQALDIMAQAGKEGGFELRDMAREFPQLTSAAAALGWTGTEAVASLGAALQVAMKGASDPSTAANNLANFLAKIASPETVDKFSKLGIDIKEALAEGVAVGQNPMEVVMQQIAEATGADLGKAMEGAFDANGKLIEGAAEQIAGRFGLGQLFGDRQVQDFLAPMLANYGQYLEIKKASLGATGVVDQDFANMTKTYNESTKRMGLAFDKLTGSIGKSILPMVTPVINVLADGVDALANFADDMPMVTGGLVALAGGFMLVKSATLIGRYALTYYRGGIGAVVRETIGVGRASAAAATGVGRVGSAAAGSGSRIGAMIGRLRQYTAAANSAATASGRLSRAQGGIGDALGGGGIGKALRFGGKALGGVGLALSAAGAAGDLMDPNLSASEKGAAGGNLAGGLAGMAAGAAIGSVVPVIGTALGAVIGGALGSFGGEMLGGWLFKDKDKSGERKDESPASAEAAGGAGGAAQSAAGAPQTVSIGPFNIYATPGQDVRELAEQVAQLIMRQQRAALAD
ncbi:membrane hypothetical protein [uncultured Alphaproteobacteria bacterium]|uniref:Phage tail tape measure protein domain-containing protein n=1 Tax=uncultured Alphaproteobacteria bacterium TaxID=91750 RepID=A0A212KC44_9PROT|nr:membrane hypothetical protein [uncultured Alphaproteobacteria bacterium]